MQEKNDRKEDDRMKFRKLLLFTAVLLLVLSAGSHRPFGYGGSPDADAFPSGL